MAHEIPLQGGKLISEIITDIRIHIYLGRELTFVDSIIMESRKLIAPNLSPIIHDHSLSQNAIATCPFAIINGKYVKQKDDIFKLLLMLMSISDHARNPGDQEQQLNQNDFSLIALLQMCQELSEVATVRNEDDLNPFYLFLNPILKYRHYQKLEKLKTKLHTNSQFLNTDDTLNTDHFLYKLHILEQYFKQLQKKRLSIVQRKFVKICIIALMKHFSANSKNILEVALQHQEFQGINSRIIEHITDLSDYYQKLVDEKREAIGVYASFNIQNRIQQRKVEELEPFRQKIAQSLIKPAAVTLVFLTLYRIFSS